MKFLLLAGWMGTAALAAAPLLAQDSPASEGSAPDGGPGVAPDGGPGVAGAGGVGQGEMRARIMGFLPADEQERVRAAYIKAVAAHPKLQTESRDLMRDMPGIEKDTPGQRQALLEKWRSHREKMRQAMLAEDPTIGPILDQIDQHMSRLRAQRENQGAPPAQ
jgi:hypothetical protein